VTVDGKPYKNHLDGYNFLPLLAGETDLGPRNSFFYWSDDGVLTGIRTGDWKVVFAEQRAKGFAVWREEFDQLRIPKLFNLRRDPFERADENADNYDDWWVRKVPPRIASGAHRASKVLNIAGSIPAASASCDLWCRSDDRAALQSTKGAGSVKSVSNKDSRTVLCAV